MLQVSQTVMQQQLFHNMKPVFSCQSPAPKINVVVRNWFNPNLFYLWYTVVSLIAILLQPFPDINGAFGCKRKRIGNF